MSDTDPFQNWTKVEKYTTYIVCCFFTLLAFMNSSAFTVAIKPIIIEFHKTSTEASYLTSLQVLGMGFGPLFLVFNILKRSRPYC